MPNNVKILLAEDTIQYSLPIKDFLIEEGFEVLLAESISEVEEKIQDADVIIMDAVMPEEKEGSVDFEKPRGIEILFEMISSGTLEPHIPVIVMSEYVSDLKQKLIEHSLEDDRFICLDKPFALDVLIEIIKEELNRVGR